MRYDREPQAEHLYSLLGKRIVVGAETNRGQRIDAAQVKLLTGEDKITCRPKAPITKPKCRGSSAPSPNTSRITDDDK